MLTTSTENDGAATGNLQSIAKPSTSHLGKGAHNTLMKQKHHRRVRSSRGRRSCGRRSRHQATAEAEPRPPQPRPRPQLATPPSADDAEVAADMAAAVSAVATAAAATATAAATAAAKP